MDDVFVLYRHQNAGEYRNIKTADMACGNVAKSKYMGTPLTDLNCVREYVFKSRLTFWRRTFFFQILAHPVFKM